MFKYQLEVNGNNVFGVVRLTNPVLFSPEAWTHLVHLAFSKVLPGSSNPEYIGYNTLLDVASWLVRHAGFTIDLPDRVLEFWPYLDETRPEGSPEEELKKFLAQSGIKIKLDEKS